MGGCTTAVRLSLSSVDLRLTDCLFCRRRPLFLSAHQADAMYFDQVSAALWWLTNYEHSRTAEAAVTAEAARAEESDDGDGSNAGTDYGE